MQKANRQIIFVEKQRDILYMSIVQKQNQIGFSYNQRLFLLSESHFGYISKFKIAEDPKKFEMSQCKVHQPIKNIKKLKLKDQILEISFLTVQNKRTIEKVWVFKFMTKELATQWHVKLQQQRFRTNTRRSKSSHKSVSPRKSQQKLQPFSKNLLTDHQKIQNPKYQQKLRGKKQTIGEQGQSKVRVDAKLFDEYDFIKSPGMMQGQNPINRIVYNNELYKEPIEQKQQEYSRSNLMISDKQIQADLMRQRSERQQKQQERKQAKVQLQRSAENNRILQENLNQFTRNSRHQKDQKQQDFNDRAGQQKDDSSRTKQPNYYAMINKIVSQSKSKQNIDNQHHFHQQKRKAFLQYKQISNDSIQQNQKSKQEIRPIQSYNSDTNFDLDWTYRYLTQPHATVFSQFKKFCSDLAQQILCDLSFSKQQRSQVRRGQKREQIISRKGNAENIIGSSRIVNDFIFYETKTCQIKIALIKLKQSMLQKNSVMGQKICDTKASKQLKNQFKNYFYLYKTLENSGKIIIPLVSLVQYQGFTLLFKSKSKCIQNIDIWKSLPKQDLLRIQQGSRISVNTLTIQQGTKIFPIDSQYYSRIYEALHKKFTRLTKPQQFQKFVIQELQSFLPIDLLFDDHVDQSLRLRQQLVRLSYSQAVSQQTNENDKYLGIREFKGKIRAEQKQLNKVRNLSKGVLQCVSNVISALDSLEFVPLNSKELSQFLHANGVNIRYLSLIYQNLSLPLPKTIIAAEIVARTSKIVLNKTIQDIAYSRESAYAHNHNKSSQNEGNHSGKLQILDDTIDFLNCIVGNNYETSALWKVLEVHSNQYFNISFGTQDVNRGYFLLALAYHSKIKIRWSRIAYEDVFKSSHCFNHENVEGLNLTVKTYAPIFDQTVAKTFEIIGSETEQNFNTLVQLLDLHRRRIPNYFFEVECNEIYSTLGDSVKAFLSSFIHPETVIPSNLKYTNLKLFDEERLQYLCYPTRDSIQLLLRQIRWYMKEKKRQKYIKACDFFLRKVHKFFGDFHPLLSEVYELFSHYHMSNHELQDSITFSKSALVVIIKLCGTNHLKTAQAYYQLALCYIKAAKKQEAISQLIKAKNIFESDYGQGYNANIESFGYAVILNKLALLQLNQGNVQDTVKLALGSLAILDNLYSRQNEKLGSSSRQKKYTKRGKDENDQPEKVENERTQAYEILARCYQLSQRRDEQMKLSNYCSEHLQEIKNPLNLQRNLKICLYPYFNSLSPQLASSYLDIISQIPLTVSAATYGESYKLLKQRVEQHSLMDNFKNYLLNLNNIEQYIAAQGVFKNWENFSHKYERETVNDFVCLNEELLFFLGQGFVTGAIREAL